MSAMLVMWTVYVPGAVPQYPLSHVAKEFELSAAGVSSTGTHMLSPDVDLIRGELQRRGLIRMAPSVHDDPKILETWL